MLPSVLASQPALIDDFTTEDDIKEAQALVKVTSPAETPLFLCTLPDCNRLFPTRERIMTHRKRDHPTLSEDELNSNILTWNE